MDENREFCDIREDDVLSLDWQPGELHLARVEAAGMQTLTRALLDGELKQAWSVARLLRYLSIV